MEAVVEGENMRLALKQVEQNRGAAGVDNMTVGQMRAYLREHWLRIKEELLAGVYQPSAVRKVEIPKPGGRGMRMLGIPTVIDRLIQQALHQVLGPLFEPSFSESSYGFRPQRSAQQAALKAREYVREGRRWVVDIDLEKFFDRRTDVTAGAANQRQASTATDTQVPASRNDVGRVGKSTPRGNTARWAALAAALEHPARRVGQGVGATWSQVLPLR